MYTLRSWRSHLGSVGDALLHQEPARTVADPLTAFIPGEVTQVSRINNVPVSFWKSHMGIVGIDILHQEPARTLVDPFTAYVPG